VRINSIPLYCRKEAHVQLELSAKSVLIVASERSKWHESLTLENSSWFQEYGGHPRIADALHRTDIKYVSGPYPRRLPSLSHFSRLCYRYCSSAKDALILLTLLHPQPENSSAKGESDASVLTEGVPSLIITWDLLNLFLEPENHENDPDSVGIEKEIREEGTANLLAREVPAKEPLTVRFLDGYVTYECETRRFLTPLILSIQYFTTRLPFSDISTEAISRTARRY
jgi:hypothetical protein